MISRFFTFVIRFIIRFYQRILNPMLKVCAGPAMGCRYTPSCSNYFLQAVETHGPVHGSWMGISRIFRCHPWGGYGYDPVPEISITRQPPGNSDCRCGSSHP